MSYKVEAVSDDRSEAIDFSRVADDAPAALLEFWRRVGEICAELGIEFTEFHSTVRWQPDASSASAT